MTLRLLQHRADDGKRSVIVDDGVSARFVNGAASTCELALQAIESGSTLAETISRLGLGPDVHPAAELAAGRIMAPIDHEDSAHLLMSGTGLTHLGSADARDRMHRMAATEKQTDSMRMFLEGSTAESLAKEKPAVSPNGFTRATARSWSRPASRWLCPTLQRTAARNRNSLVSI